MDKIYFKRQTGRVAQALVIESRDPEKTALFDSLYNESQMFGQDIVLNSVDRLAGSDGFVYKMTFGLGNNSFRMGLQSDTLFANAIPAKTLLLCIVIENETVNPATLSMGTLPGLSDIFSSATIAQKVGDVNGLTTIGINKPFSLDIATSAFLHHENTGDTWNGAKLNVSFILRDVS